MTINPETAINSLERRVSENISTLMFRMGWQRKDLAAAAHMNAGTLGRKLKNLSAWHVGEVEKLASILHVKASELMGDLPDYETWCAIKGSNLGPTDMESAQVSGGRIVSLGEFRRRLWTA